MHTYRYKTGIPLRLIQPEINCFVLCKSLVLILIHNAFCIMQDVVFQWLMTDNIHLNQIDAEDPEVRMQTHVWNSSFTISLSISIKQTLLWFV